MEEKQEGRKDRRMRRRQTDDETGSMATGLLQERNKEKKTKLVASKVVIYSVWLPM